MENSPVSVVGILLYLVLIVFYLGCMWKIYTKAGAPGWGAIIPIYNIYLMCKMADVSPWLILGMFVPGVNIIVSIYLTVKFLQSFGREGILNILGFIFLSFIYIPYMAMSSNVQYIGAYGRT